MTEAQSPDMTNLSGLVDACRYDTNALANGHKASATALRKKLSLITKECSKLRSQALAYQKSLKSTRKAKTVVEPVESEPDIEELVDDVEQLDITPAPPPKKKRGRRKKV